MQILHSIVYVSILAAVASFFLIAMDSLGYFPVWDPFEAVLAHIFVFGLIVAILFAAFSRR